MVVAGYHLIWTAYGHWLPNDPRGSTSTKVRSVDLQDLGELHFSRKRLQPARRIVKAFYEEAKQRLKHDLLTLDDRETTAVAAAFANVIKAQRYTCYACAIMPDHVHLLIRKHRHQAEEMIESLQDASCLAVRGRRCLPPSQARGVVENVIHSRAAPAALFCCVSVASQQ